MHTRTLGATDLQASAIGLGCMGMSQSYGEADPVESEATLRRALDVGVTFWDTANAYGSAGAIRRSGAEHRTSRQCLVQRGIPG